MIKFYNTYTKKKEIFKPIEKRKAKIYTCGPTVYDYAHIGNFRSYLTVDLLRRLLEFSGFGVEHVMNITDVGHLTFDDDIDASGEDKIEAKAKKENKKPDEIVHFFTKAFLGDIKKLRIKKPHKMPKATDHIEDMIKIIEQLIENKHAYVVGNNVYYEIKKFKTYGALSGNKLKNLKAGARLAIKEEKKSPHDFALWLHDPNHLMQWDSPWGRGYPGWHIECSAMSMRYLGDSFDIHTGGEDNKFPHHECEIAQSEGTTGKKFVNYWIHTKHLIVDNQKMSKSLGNFYTLKDLVDKEYNPVAFRYLCLSTQYRKPLNFTLDSLKNAEKTINNINGFIAKILDEKEETKSTDNNEMVLVAVGDARKKFIESLEDDLNTPEAMAAVFDLMRVVNKALDEHVLCKKTLQEIHNFMIAVDSIFDFIIEQEPLTDEEKKLIFEREDARKKKDFEKSDHIRDVLRKRGIDIEDTLYGPRWKRKL
ncbi:cysteine--tRNA ligase [Candidatus Aenigmatarchaeota archaeon]